MTCFNAILVHVELLQNKYNASSVAVLHRQAECAPAELFEEASSLLRPGDDTKQSSERLRKAIALSSNLSKIRAWKAVAAREAERTNLGVACADLQVTHILV